eukprot:1088544-Rhodomonas_salina.1
MNIHLLCASTTTASGSSLAISCWVQTRWLSQAPALASPAATRCSTAASWSLVFNIGMSCHCCGPGVVVGLGAGVMERCAAVREVSHRLQFLFVKCPVVKQ